ncbi:DNA adenine methylase [Chryseobacterium sp. MEBOG07]|uniref:DNA adenine methylase n=1 Tax=Chryseobacterium sp. MEBOG07 TaxID=2879939 RepID=UPI001F020D25|nr:DNA adenine methylase [Chryseobacterium sp. MEBOG07]UKB81031.1 DNA adenine methylase [Chryseobacterium sp. MEBOG07]
MEGVVDNLFEDINFADKFSKFPGTRYMGSKNKLIPHILKILNEYEFDSFYDAFAGSNVVSYLFKTIGKKVITNDFLNFSYLISKSLIENSFEKLNEDEVSFLINTPNKQEFITKTFKDLYFDNNDNKFLDTVRGNIDLLDSEYKRAIALSALVRACMKKRARGIFTFTGERYDDGRKDMRLTLEEHFRENVISFNNAVFSNDKNCISHNSSAQNLVVETDLIYLDPPYYTPNSDNDYVRRYHFVEGLTKNWNGLEIQDNTKTKKFKSYHSPFSTKKETYLAFENLIQTYKDSIIVISYSSNSLPNKDELLVMLKNLKKM